MIYYALTDIQKAIWYTEMLFSDTGISNIAVRKKMDNIAPDILQKAIQLFVDSNEMMRIRLSDQNGPEPVQYVATNCQVKVAVENLQQYSEEQREEWYQKQAKIPFSLYDSDLFEFKIVTYNDDSFLFLKVHHIIMDGISVDLLIKNVLAICEQLQRGEQIKLDEQTLQHYLHSQQEYLASKRFQKDQAFWQQEFDPFPEHLTNYEETLYTKSSAAKRKMLTIPVELKSKMESFCAEHNISLNSLLLSVFFLYFARSSNKDEITLGNYLANRNRNERDTLGMFANALSFYMKVDNDLQVLEFIRNVNRKQMKLLRHQKYPYHRLLHELREQGNSAKQLFTIGFEYQNVTSDVSPIFCGHDLNLINIHIKNYLAVDELVINIDYRQELFEELEIEQMSERLLALFEHVLSSPHRPLAEIELCTPSERDLLLNDWNGTQKYYPKYKTIHELFETQVTKTPDNVAVVFNNERLTYRELNERANQVAYQLHQHGVKSDQRVGLMLERSLEMIIGILAILKAGGAYVPIDPNYPIERIRYMLDDSDAKLVLSQATLIQAFQQETKQSIEWLDVKQITKDRATSVHLSSVNRSTDLAYVIYTSGTTGQPKGVMMEHRSLVNLIYDQITSSEIPFDQKVLQFSTISFDVSFQEIFSTLLSGGSLYVVDEHTRADAKSLLNYIEEQTISIIYLPVAFLKTIFQHMNRLPVSVQHVITAGEQLVVSPTLKQYILQNDVHLHNHYGPAETHVVTTYTCNADQSFSEHPPIGKPIANTKIYLLNEDKQLQPPGAIGEIYIAGDNVSRGYLGKPELTAERFIDSPFVPGERMYKTGDLGRYLADGNIQYLGRIDHQVKVRGYRIEPTEIESVLLEHAQVTDATVKDWKTEQGEAFLCAYIVPNQSLQTAELREYLLQKLPEYMVPAFFVEIKQIPLTPNGKVNRQALPKPDASLSQTEYVPPTTDLEKQLVEIWQEVLEIERIGITDHFFQIGGHSLKVIQLVSIIQQRLEVEVQVRSIFAYPTISQLASHMQDQESVAFQAIPPAPVQADYPVSSAQKRVFVLQRMEPEKTHYNMPGALVLKGSLHPIRLERAFQKLIDRHESLRTSFVMINGEPRQRVHQHVSFQLPVQKENKKKIQDWIQPFSLEQAPLLRAELFQVAEEEHLLLVDLHHIIADGVAIDVLLHDLSQFYHGKSLPQLHIQYKDFAVWEQEWMQSEAFQQQEQYWLTQLAGDLPVLELPTDHPHPEMQTFAGDQVYFTLDRSITSRLKELASETGTTLYMMLLTAYNILLHKYTGQTDLTVGTPVVGRPHADIQKVLGMFANSLVMRNQPSKEKTVLQFIQEVKETALAAYEHADYPFEMLVEKLEVTRDISRNPIFQTVFTLQDFGNDLLTIDGLQVEPYEMEYTISKVDLSLWTTNHDGQIDCRFEYATALFEKETIQQMAVHLKHIIESLVDNPKQQIGEVEMLTTEEKQLLTVNWNDTASQVPAEPTIHALFEKQVKYAPHQIAVIHKDKRWTYQMVNEQANQVARMLQRMGVKAEDRVGLFMERSIDMIVGLLGILKAGGAYVPIDADYPADRINYILQDSGANIVLSQAAIIKDVAANTNKNVQWVDIQQATAMQIDTSNLALISQPTDLAYVIYTSGTTGRPKGVMIEHRSVVNLVHGLGKKINPLPSDRVSQFVSMAFDASVGELAISLLSGATMVIIPPEVIRDYHAFKSYVNQHKLTLLSLPPSYLAQLKREQYPWVRQVLAIGSATPNHVVEKWKDIYTNAYGPTEATVYMTVWEGREENYATAYAPLGKPITNMQAYIVDESMKLQPVGVAGELCIGGIGLARGYLNKAELTAEKFVPHPFVEGQRLYRTGDLARYMSDGTIEYLGRMDHQVKVRGYRMELGEIEAVLLEHPMVKEATVRDWKDAQKETYLCAYVVSDSSVSITELKEHLGKKLPSFMIPAYLMQLDQLPLNANGKIDRKALQKPDAVQLQTEYVAPRTQTEIQLVHLWQEILGIDRVGVTDHFFQIGGHSIKAITLISKIDEVFHIQLSLSTIFQYPQIDQLAAYIEQQQTQIQTQTSNLPFVTLFNQKTDVPVFCFPPISGFGTIFSAFAQMSEEHSIYGFDFLLSDNRLQQYIDQIVTIQPTGPYTLLGYSAGCALIFEIAKQMESQGLQIEKLIMLDGAPSKAQHRLSEKQIELRAEKEVEVYLQHQFGASFSQYTKQEFIKHVKHYRMYINGLVSRGKVQAPIHLITSTNDIPGIKDWETMTSQLEKYQGFGDHLNMLVSPHLEQNIEILRNILQQKQIAFMS